MHATELHNTLKQHRDRAGLSQRALADRVGVSRQAIISIEAGRQVPSTTLSLALAQVLGCSVENLFRLVGGSELEVRLADAAGPTASVSERVSVGRVEQSWVAHRLEPNARLAADALLTSESSDSTVSVAPLSSDHEQLRCNVFVAGCAPLLGLLSHRVGTRFDDARVTWLPASSRRALDLLRDGLVHVAGVHLHDAASGPANVAAVRELFSDRQMLVVNLTRWRQGLVVRPGNPRSIRGAEDLLREGLRFAGREEGAGAAKLVAEALASAGASTDLLDGPIASGHEDVARLVACGAADAGIAIESVALASGLDFVSLSEERFDLVVPATLAETSPVSRLLDALDDPTFRTEVTHIPGYDTGIAGHVTTLEPSP